MAMGVAQGARDTGLARGLLGNACLNTAACGGVKMEMEMEARGGAEGDFALERGWAWAWWECCICGRIQFSCIVLCSVRSTSVIISWQLHLMPARHDMAWCPREEA